MCRSALAVAVVTFLVAWAGVARAQLHADVGLEAGVAQRILSSSPPGGAEPGPMFELSGHVAVLPLLRAGAYVSFDLSPIGGLDTRELLSAGLTSRLYSPWPRGDWRVWLGLGVGYAAAHAPAYGTSARGACPCAPAASGGFFEVPVGVGASLRLSRSFELIGDLGTRIGFGFSGTMYNHQAPLPLAWTDTLGIFLVVGAAFEL